MASEMLTSGASGRVSALISLSAWRSLLRMMIAIIFVIVGPFRAKREKPASISVSAKEEKVVSGGCGGGGPIVRLPAAIVRRVVVEQEVAVRRMMAVRRVKEDKDEKCLRDYSLFGTPRGVTLFTQSWSPVSRNVRGLVLLLHGLNEHSGRYSDFAKQLNGIGFKVYGMDWIGLSILIGCTVMLKK